MVHEPSHSHLDPETDPPVLGDRDPDVHRYRLSHLPNQFSLVLHTADSYTPILAIRCPKFATPIKVSPTFRPSLRGLFIACLLFKP